MVYNFCIIFITIAEQQVCQLCVDCQHGIMNMHHCISLYNKTGKNQNAILNNETKNENLGDCLALIYQTYINIYKRTSPAYTK